MNKRTTIDWCARRIFMLITIACCMVVVAMAGGLAIKAFPVIREQSLAHLLFSSEWAPLSGKFGMFPFLVGTVLVTLLALVIAVPVSLLTAIYLSEYAPGPLRAAMLPVVDLLSGIPSVIYGIVGVLAIVPAVAKLSDMFNLYASGYSLLAGGIVLAVMISPFIINLSREVISAVPMGLREASLALGATRWQTIKLVVLRKAFPGVLAAVVLGVVRALGETIAVLMVVGNVPQVPHSLFDPAYPLPALLANNYGEMMSIPMYDSALMFSALLLLAVVLCFNLLAKLILVTVRSA